MNTLAVQPLETVGGEELQEMQLPPKEFVIEGLLPKGLAMLVGSTKVGKSFLSLQIALAVSSGENLWSFPTHKGHVLVGNIEPVQLNDKFVQCGLVFLEIAFAH